LYDLPKVLHFSQRHIVTSPQFGQGKRTAPSPGIMVLEHQVQVGIRTVLVSLSFNAFFSYRAPAAIYLSVARGWTQPIHPTGNVNLGLLRRTVAKL
jgi:hypothetical protein